MTTMGRHSPPINGHVLVPLAKPLVPGGPVSVLPRTELDSRGRWRHAVSARRAWLAAVPIVLVNAVAFAGQLAFLRVHLPWPLAGQVLVAVTLESVAVYLAWQAHLALAADDSALRLRLAAYAFAAVIGVMNYSHYMAAGWRPTFAAVTFGLMSVSSPWLWSVHSRRASRDALKARGLIEPHAVRLGVTRWLWHPARSARVMFRATWAGETDPARAIALTAAPVAPAVAPVVTPRHDSDHDKRGDKLPCPPVPRKAVAPMTKTARAAVAIRDNPGMKNAELAALVGCDVRTIQHARSRT
jgi:hypothetical protein